VRGLSLNTRGYKPLSLAGAAAVICLLVYLRALSCDFINWDDPLYVVENPAIRLLDWQFVREAFITTYMGWWMPLTWISFAIDYHFWGLNPLGYHLTNIVLHAANTGLVVLIADQLLRADGTAAEEPALPGGSGGTSAPWLYSSVLLLAGLLWALHPLRVESVAWVTERKDVLNGLFSLAAILFYLRFVRFRDGAGNKGIALCYYIFSLLALLLSLMAKPVSVVIPAMLLVADWYPLGRFERGRSGSVLLEKLPFLLLVASFALLTLQFASANQILVSYQDMSLAQRFLLAGNSLFEYVKLSLYPFGIIHIYLLPWPLPAAYTVKTAIICTVSVLAVWRMHKNPWMLATWLAFVLPLLPVLGFFQNGAQSHAARFTYLPAVLPSICAAALLGSIYQRVAQSRPCLRLLLVVPLVAVPIVYTVETVELIGSWKNPETLWSRVIAIQPIGRAYYLRADYYLQQGRYGEAAADLLTSINMARKAGYPEIYNLHALRGDALNKGRRYTEAVQEFSEAIALYPHPTYFYHRGLALRAEGQARQAQADFDRAGNEHGAIEWQKR